jgi:hypothetical protein
VSGLPDDADLSALVGCELELVSIGVHSGRASGLDRVRNEARMLTMDRFEGRCWFEWWANSSTLLAAIEVGVVITTSSAGWDACGRLTSDLGDEDHEGYAFLCDIDPVFTLRFEGDSTIDVIVHPTDEYRGFTLTEYTGPVHREVETVIDLTAYGTSGS